MAGNENGIKGTSDAPGVFGTLSDEMRHAAAVCGEAAPAATSFGATPVGGGEAASHAAVGRDESERACSASGVGAMDCWPDDVTEAIIPRRTRFSTLAMSVSDPTSVVLDSASGWPSEGPDRSLVFCVALVYYSFSCHM